jgi:arginase family enzyme
MLGVRDLDPAEREPLGHSAIQVVKWHEGKPQSDMKIALDRLARQVSEVYVHIDMDTLDPRVAPGVLLAPVPAGMSLETSKSLFAWCLPASASERLRWQSMIRTKTTRRLELRCALSKCWQDTEVKVLTLIS